MMSFFTWNQTLRIKANPFIANKKVSNVIVVVFGLFILSIIYQVILFSFNFAAYEPQKPIALVVRGQIRILDGLDHVEHPTVKAMKFDATQSIAVMDAHKWNLNDFTIEIWLKLFQYPTPGNEACVLSHGDYSGRFKLSFLSDRRMRITFKFSHGTIIDHDTAILDIREGQWHHIAITYRSSTSEVVLYLDGQMQDQGFFGGTDNPLAETERDLRVGRCHFSGMPFHGYIYSIKLHYQAHTFTQIRKDVLNYDKYDGIQDDVVAHYVFIEDHSFDDITSSGRAIRMLNKRELPLNIYNSRYHGEVIGGGVPEDVPFDIDSVIKSASMAERNDLGTIEERSYDMLWKRDYTISIIIPHTHHLEYLTECLQGLMDTTRAFYNGATRRLNEVIVVETQSGTLPTGFNSQPSANGGPAVTVLYHKESVPLPLTAAINHGIKNSKGDYVIILDDSVITTNNWLEELILVMEKEPKVAVAGSRLLYPNGLIFAAGMQNFLVSPDYTQRVPALFYRLRGYKSEALPNGEHQIVDAVSYHGMILRRETLENIGPLKAGVPIEVAVANLCFRAWVLGSTVVFVSRSSLYLASPPVPPHQPLSVSSAVASAPSQQISAITKQITDRYVVDDISVQWVMHCGGSMGFEAANLLYGLEKVLDVRASIRNHRQCEHTDTLSQLPISFQETLDRLVEYEKPLNKTEIVVYHRDYRELGRWVSETADYVIGRYMFETDGLPRPWVENCNQLDEIWVPASVFVESFSRSGVERSKIFVIPEALDMRFYDPEKTVPLNALAQTKRGYTFLSVFKLEERKGWKLLIRAFYEEFSNIKDIGRVTLAIRTYIYNDPDAHNKNKILRMLRRYAEEIGVVNYDAVPHIEIIADHLPASAMPSLYKAADAFVLPTHGEGWGLPIMEAMAMGLPAIATSWGGNMEFMNRENSYPIDLDGMVSTTSTDEWLKGFRWAQPSVKHLRELMRRCVEDPATCKKKGELGRQHILKNYSIEKVAQLIASRVKAIKTTIQSPSYKLLQSSQTKNRRFDKTHGLSGEFVMCARRPKAPISLREKPDSLAARGWLNLAAPIVYKKRIAIISTYPPTKCGIGTFTWDLVNSGFGPMQDTVEIEIIAMVKNDDEYFSRSTFDSQLVKRRVRQQVARDYDEAAMYINESGFDLVIIEHEFGIFKGGPNGAYIVCFARSLSVPSAVTIHTVKKRLSEEEHAILQQLFLVAKNVIVMTNTMKKMLDTHHNLYSDKVIVIPHGVRNTPYPDREVEKSLIKIDNKMRTILGFGLIHPGKGYEHVIRAMPAILKEHPATLFMIYGKAHPTCNPPCETYVRKLKDMVRDMRLEKHVIFDDNFLTDEQLDHVLGATDIYITPYTDTEQSVSGTVALALSKGCVVASSSYYYVNEVLRDGEPAGVIFDNLSAKSISTTIIQLLKDNVKLKAMSKRAYKITREWVWENIAAKHAALID